MAYLERWVGSILNGVIGDIESLLGTSFRDVVSEVDGIIDTVEKHSEADGKTACREIRSLINNRMYVRED